MVLAVIVIKLPAITPVPRTDPSRGVAEGDGARGESAAGGEHAQAASADSTRVSHTPVSPPPPELHRIGFGAPRRTTWLVRETSSDSELARCRSQKPCCF
eukprot:9467349-Pyramimonas_sp.AAC.1